MLRSKLFKGFALLVMIFSVLSVLIGIRTIGRRVTEEAQSRVRLDLRSARAEFNNGLSDIEIILRAVADSPTLAELCEQGDWDSSDLRLRLERVRVRERLDFLELVSPDGVVMMRSTPLNHTGDSRVSDATVARAMQGEASTAMALLSEPELELRGVGLAEQAFLELEDTPRSRHLQKKQESRGMVMVGAVPVKRGTRLLGIVYGGTLVNRNHALIDRIHDVVYKNEEYDGQPLGTATIFLGDSRIATTVRCENGNRALGTRVSKEVADRVLDNALPWVGEAFVVRDWYLAAYEPIKDELGGVIGMLYVGILKEPYDNAAQSVAWQFVVMSVFVLLIALVLAFTIAGRLAQPIHRLVEASNRMRRGQNPGIVPADKACQETEQLIVAFNEMATSLAEREESLKALNRHYMETLGFVSHELRSPVSMIMNYGYLLRKESIGGLNEKQRKAVNRIEAGGKRLIEMVRHYLNLSRIENGELEPVLSKVHVRRDVVEPLVKSVEADLETRSMKLTQDLEDDVVLKADMNQVREVFENLIGNAIKYGCDDGTIAVKSRSLNGFVEFSVRNDGDGIPSDEIGDLFKKFSRLKGSGIVNRQKGTGLGLFITKHVVEAHGGQITATSEPGKWAQFAFTLPRWETQHADGPDQANGVIVESQEIANPGYVA